MKFYFDISVLIICLTFTLQCTKETLHNNIEITVKVDERVSDFCKRMESRNLFTCKELEGVVNTKNLDQYRFINPDVKGLRKLEGMFRPGAYYYNREVGLELLVIRMLDVAEKDYELKKNHPLRIQEIITLASIVEKEAVSNKDYKKIARVFLNRLQKNEPLGSCPTVEYALGFHRPFLLFKDLDLDSPYNVYRKKGLPPTAISFFSKEALDAVMNPVINQNYFFVYDWTTGDLHFAKEYTQHKINAQRARKNFINKYGKGVMYKVFPDKFYEDI